LLAMHAGEYRTNGGLGFSIAAPLCDISICTSPIIEIEDKRTRALSDHEQSRLRLILERERSSNCFKSGISISISGEMWAHFGYGSGTAITLASLESLHRINRSAPLPATLISASGRGGTSGIGIQTYFKGGCILDLGRPIDERPFAPSHKVENGGTPLVLDHLDMPMWDIGICVPFNIASKSHAEEEAFFARTCPAPSGEVYRTLYHVLFGLYASIRENDRKTFCSALRMVQEGYWKKAETAEYGKPLIDIERDLYSCGATAVCMSSLGPCLFYLADDVSEVIRRMKPLRADCDYLVTVPANHGRIMQDV
jgi:beta-ribofuranosylaminobenzene 5'-phosphate synthase